MVVVQIRFIVAIGTNRHIKDIVYDFESEIVTEYIYENVVVLLKLDTRNLECGWQEAFIKLKAPFRTNMGLIPVSDMSSNICDLLIFGGKKRKKEFSRSNISFKETYLVKIDMEDFQNPKITKI